MTFWQWHTHVRHRGGSTLGWHTGQHVCWSAHPSGSCGTLCHSLGASDRMAAACPRSSSWLGPQPAVHKDKRSRGARQAAHRTANGGSVQRSMAAEQSRRGPAVTAPRHPTGPCEPRLAQGSQQPPGWRHSSASEDPTCLHPVHLARTPVKKRCSQYAQSRQFLRHQSQHCSGVGTFEAFVYSWGHSGFQLLKNTTGLAGSVAVRAEVIVGARRCGRAFQAGGRWLRCVLAVPQAWLGCVQAERHLCGTGPQDRPAARTAVAQGPQVIRLVCERVAAAGRGRRCRGHRWQWWGPVVGKRAS